MNDTIIVAVLSLIGTLGGSLLGILAANKLTNYRIEQLEKKSTSPQQPGGTDVSAGRPDERVSARDRRSQEVPPTGMRR